MNTKILSNNENDLKIAADIIRSGGTVVFPTETVYGLGANALDPSAVKKIFEAKGRPGDNPLIVHIYKKEQAEEVAEDIPETARKLMDEFWPGPLTIILKRKPCIPSEVTAGLDTVGIRMPKNSSAAELLRLADVPVAAPSANISGKPSPTAFKHCVDDMDGKVDAIIDGGSCDVGIESTVIDLSGEPVIYRPGDISRDRIESVIGQKVELVKSVANDEKPKSPGLKYKHYSPNADVVILHGDVDRVLDCVNSQTGKCGIILFDEILSAVKDKLDKTVYCISLGSGTSPKDASAALFAALREMDENGVKIIFAPEIPDTDKWAGVRNRLYRAAGNTVYDAELFGEKYNMSKKRVLFVCTGNTCRSPMAEGLFNSLAKKQKIDWLAESAGLFVLPGAQVSDNSVKAMQSIGIDISGHKPVQLTADLIKRADLILTMSVSHKQAIASLGTEFTNKTYTLTEYAGSEGDIADPYGGSYEQYYECMLEIKRCAVKAVERCKTVKDD